MQNDEQEAALLLLEQIISNKWPDKAAAEQLYNTYLEEIRKRESGLGRITAAGKSFVTGEVNSFEELAGASLADFFLYGDVRDITKELVFEDDANEFIVTLSGLGVLTTVFPPADPAVSLLKTSYKSGSLTQPMVKHITTILEPVKKSPGKLSVATLKNVVSQIKPIWELAKQCKTWQQFSLFMKHCQNIKQVKFISKIISIPGNSKKLASLLSSVKAFPKLSAKSLTFIHTYGQKGMDAMYSVLRKGPDGIQFIVKNPKLYSKLTKNAGKATLLSKQRLDNGWSQLLSKYGAPVNILRYVVAFMLLYSLKFLFVKKKTIVQNDSQVVKDETNGKTQNLLFIAGGVMLVLLLAFSLNNFGSEVNQLVESEQSLNSAGRLKFSSIIFFIIFTLVQGWSVYKAKQEVEDIKKIDNVEKKMRLLDNSEFYFDLPVYAGLAGTVCAFILLNYDPGGSRILAYATTVTGITISVFLRGKWLFPLKKTLIHGGKDE